jgi:serine/threonine-protein kinase
MIPPMSGQALTDGVTIGGKYLVEGYLGGGGIGEVYRATHTWTGRMVALKVLRPHYAEEPSVVQRFFSEAKLTARLKHPNVVDVLDMGSDGRTVYLVLECLVGASLADYLNERGRLDLANAQRLLLPIMRALDLAHRAGVVHRDLKPDNIFLHRDETGRTVPKLLDFGLAKVAQASKSGLTIAGSILGTPAYMSPEQAQGAEDVGPSADVWALGVTLYECLAGVCPFTGQTARELLVNIIMGNHTPLGTIAPVSAEVERVVEGALRAKPAERWTMGEMAGAFEAVDATDAETDSWMYAPTEHAASDDGATSGVGLVKEHALEAVAEARGPAREASQADSIVLPRSRAGLVGWLGAVVILGLLAAGGAAYHFWAPAERSAAETSVEQPGAQAEVEAVPSLPLGPPPSPAPSAAVARGAEPETTMETETQVAPDPVPAREPEVTRTAMARRERRPGRAMARREMTPSPTPADSSPTEMEEASMRARIPSLERDWE